MIHTGAPKTHWFETTEQDGGNGRAKTYRKIVIWQCNKDVQTCVRQRVQADEIPLLHLSSNVHFFL